MPSRILAVESHRRAIVRPLTRRDERGPMLEAIARAAGGPPAPRIAETLLADLPRAVDRSLPVDGVAHLKT